MAQLVQESSCNAGESEVTQLCLTLCDPVYCSLPGSSVHRILQARILEWVTISFERGSPALEADALSLTFLNSLVLLLGLPRKAFPASFGYLIYLDDAVSFFMQMIS